MDYKTPIYQQLRHLLKELVDSGEYLPGEFIPSERELAKTYGVNRNTVKKAVQTLVDDGLLVSIPSSGTYVKGDNSIIELSAIDDLTTLSMTQKLLKKGKKPFNKLLSNQIISKNIAINTKLELNADEEIFFLSRLRKTNEENVAVEHCYIPTKYFPDIQSIDFSVVSLYDYMEKYGLKPAKFKRSLNVSKAGTYYGNLLNLEPETNIYIIEFYGLTETGEIIEYTKAYINPNTLNYKFKSTKNNNIQ